MTSQPTRQQSLNQYTVYNLCQKHPTFFVTRNVKSYLPMKEHGLKLLTQKSQYHQQNKCAYVF